MNKGDLKGSSMFFDWTIPIVELISGGILIYRGYSSIRNQMNEMASRSKMDNDAVTFIKEVTDEKGKIKVSKLD